MSDPNIERFDQLTGLVFSKLYGSFPIPIDLYVMDFKAALFYEKELTEDDKYLGGEPFYFFEATIAWLIESGYIVERHKSSYAYKFEDCTLTAKTLEILKATPSTLSGESIGASLQAAAKGGMVEAIKSLANDALSKGLGLATRAAIDLANT
ncbi:hypothetical protein [Pseudomonas sp. SDO5591_S426]